MLKKVSAFIKNYLMQRKAYRFFIRDWIQLTDLQKASDILSTMRFSQNLQPEQYDKPTADRILVIAPHPDDEAIGPGGTLIKAIKSGAHVLTLYLTSTPTLQEEARNIAKQAGYETIFLNNCSKEIPVDDITISMLANTINEFKPQVVFIPFLLDDHDDHRRASHLLLAAQPQIQTTFHIWAYQVYTNVFPNVVVDITDVADEKEKMIMGWKTQNKTRNWAHYALGMNAFNQRFLLNGPEKKYAEIFFMLPFKEYIKYCQVYFKKPSDCYYAPNYK